MIRTPRSLYAGDARIFGTQSLRKASSAAMPTGAVGGQAEGVLGVVEDVLVVVVDVLVVVVADALLVVVVVEDVLVVVLTGGAPDPSDAVAVASSHSPGAMNEKVAVFDLWTSSGLNWLMSSSSVAQSPRSSSEWKKMNGLCVGS
jgi:hypothetical protein